MDVFSQLNSIDVSSQVGKMKQENKYRFDRFTLSAFKSTTTESTTTFHNSLTVQSHTGQCYRKLFPPAATFQIPYFSGFCISGPSHIAAV